MNIYAQALIAAVYLAILLLALGLLYNSFKSLARGEGSYDPHVRRENLVSIWVGVILCLIVVAAIFKRCVF
jgi:hypothetical protein